MLKRLVFLSATLLLIFTSSVVHAHSWVHCTDYKVANGAEWDASKCKAYPRNFQNHAGSGFGVDTGYNHQDFSCKYSMSDSNYNANYPMATYNAGQTVYLTWPAKNHVAASCTNQYIPDGGTKIYISAKDAKQDPSSPGAWQEIADMGDKTSPGKGYQNCPNFCSNMDKAFCSNSFKIPDNLAPGKYALQWRWVFNPGTPYTTCWDAIILAKGASNNQPDPKPATGTPTTNPDPTPNEPLVGNAVRLASPPKTLASTPNTISVTVEYSADQDVDVIVDLLYPQNNYAWYGKAIKTGVSKGSGKISMQIQVQNNPQDGVYVLKPWIVQAGKGANEADQGWLYELDRKEYPVGVGVKLPSSSSSRSVLSLLALLPLLLVCLF